MAEARSEEEEENMMRENREQVVRRQPNSSGGRPDRRKPEHRLSQGPLSSIRAAIKRTSTRTTSLSESPRDRERERERDRERDRRRPEITILSAEPLASTSWFPGAAAGFPPPPPPAAQIWGPTIPPSIQPPPSYEEVIREKTQEQTLPPPPPLLSSSSSSSSLSSSSRPAPTITIATQTDPGSAPEPPEPQGRRPVRPQRPPHPTPPKPTHADDITISASQSAPNIHLVSPLTSNSDTQTNQWDQRVDPEAPPTTSSRVPLQRPKPRPRSRLSAPPISSEVRVQTLVKLRDDGAATLAARTGSDPVKQEVSQGKYLQELLEAFSTDDWGFPDRRSDSSSQSESEEEAEEDMAALKARIQAFEQQQQVADGSCGDFTTTKKPEPRPRPRLQQTKSAPPTVAPKPKNFAQAPKPSCKGFWEDGSETDATDSCSLKPEPALVPVKTTEKPSISPKPQTTTDPPPSSAAPVPAPRPLPPKLTPSVSETAAKPPPRPPVAPRASVGAPPQEKSTSAGQRTPTLPPRPSVELSSGAATEAGSEGTQDAAKQTVKVGSLRPGVPIKPAALTAPRRASAPNLAPRPTAASLAAVGPSPVPIPGMKPPTPAPALRKGPVIQNKPDTSVTANTSSSDPPLPPRPSGVKLLPLRPPPIKSTPGRPPPPAVSSSANQTPPLSKTSPTPSVSPANQSTNEVKPQRATKRGPPLPPRPKPGHPLYNSNVKQEVLIILDDPSPSEHQSEDGGKTQTVVIDQSQSLLDLDSQPEPVPVQESQSKSDLEGLSLSDSQSILPLESSEQKEQADPPPVSGPRCVALFDYEGEEEDELTFSQGDVIALLELIGQEWGRGQIHGRIGIFPLNFAEVVEPPAEKPTTTETGSTAPKTSLDPDAPTAVEEWVEAVFDFPGQTAEDLSFQRGALILVTEHIDAEWRRGRLGGKEGVYPAAFTQPCNAQPITAQQPTVRGVAKFDFTAEGEEELTLKVGDVVTQVEFVGEQWILGDVGGKRGIVPKNYVSLL
ncbi:SH3 domain-containing protein 19-like isoform X2 [Eleginops maclovinus]|uniref:SH3 domain-containing protein 19-like isoform X2 n=1 Tax=Eleginops maclovinus TaxID=56733 RepID=UPI00308009CE